MKGVIALSKTINFYNVAIFKDNQKTDLEFLRFIDEVAMFPWDHRVRRIGENIAAMFPLHFNDSHREKRIIPFGKFRRNYKPFLGSVGTSDLRAIQNNIDIVELVTMVYDQRYRTAVLDYNMQGLKSKNIEEYFTSFIHRIEGSEWEIKLIPIISRRGQEDIERTMQIRYLEIKLKLDRYNQNIIDQGVRINNPGHQLILDVLDRFGTANTSIDAKNLKLEFNVGQGREATMNLETIKQLINILNLDNDYIDSVKVKYRDTNTRKLDTIDLKDIGKQFKDKILENDDNNNPASEYIGNTVVGLYQGYEGTLSQSYREFIADMVTSDFPRLVSEPREANRIPPERE